MQFYSPTIDVATFPPLPTLTLIPVGTSTWQTVNFLQKELVTAGSSSAETCNWVATKVVTSVAEDTPTWHPTDLSTLTVAAVGQITLRFEQLVRVTDSTWARDTVECEQWPKF